MPIKTLCPIEDHWTAGVQPRFVNTSVPAGNTVANTTTETAFASTCTITAGTLRSGDLIRLRLGGVHSTVATVPTLRLRIKFGTTTILDTTAVSGLIAGTNRPWVCEVVITVAAIGASGTIEATGVVTLATAAGTAVTAVMSTTAAVTINTTTDQILSASAQWSVANASNTITLRQIGIT